MNRPWWDLPATTILLGVLLIEPLPIALHFGRFDDQQLAILIMLGIGGAGMIVFGAVELLRGGREPRLLGARTQFTRGQLIEALVVIAFFGWLAWAQWPYLVSAWNSGSP